MPLLLDSDEHFNCPVDIIQKESALAVRSGCCHRSVSYESGEDPYPVCNYCGKEIKLHTCALQWLTSISADEPPPVIQKWVSVWTNIAIEDISVEVSYR